MTSWLFEAKTSNGTTTGSPCSPFGSQATNLPPDHPITEAGCTSEGLAGAYNL
jgi:hypothetical protein